MMKKNPKTQPFISIIIIIIVLFSIISTTYIVQKYNNQGGFNEGCQGPTMNGNIFNSNQSLIKNGGGWIVSILSGCKETTRWTDVILSYQQITVKGINQNTANLTYVLSDKSELLIYSTGKIYFNHDSSRMLIDQFDIKNITDNEIESFENVTFAVRETRPGNKDIINSHDFLYIFKNINGDNLNELTNNVTIYLFKIENKTTYSSGYLY
jgi:hypothetical protein